MTATATLLPIAAATTQFVVRGVGDVLKQAMDFGAMLRADGPATPADAAATSTDHAAPELSNDSRQVRWKVAEQYLNAETNAVHQRLVEKCAGLGIDLSEPIVLRTDAEGRILAATGHPDRAAIEDLFETDPGLTRQLRQLFEQVAERGGGAESDGVPPATSIRLVVSSERAFFAGE